MTEKKETISVLICTYNRPELLTNCLTSLTKVDDVPDEIIIVNGGDELANSVVDGFRNGAGLPIKLIRTKNINLATSRNIGLAACSGDIVLMTDDDAEVKSDWVTKHREAHHNFKNAGAIGGTVIGITNNHGIASQIAEGHLFANFDEVTSVRNLPGVNVSYKKSVLNSVGFQDENLDRGEDVDYNWRVREHNYDVLFVPDIIVYHNHRPTLRALVNQYYMYGKSYIGVRKKWPNMYSIVPLQLRNVRDFAKLIIFLGSILFEPLIIFFQSRNVTKIYLIPFYYLTSLAWKTGIIHGMIRAGTRKCN